MPTFVRTTNGQFEPFHEYRQTAAGAKKAAMTRRAKRGGGKVDPHADTKRKIKQYETAMDKMSKAYGKVKRGTPAFGKLSSAHYGAQMKLASLKGSLAPKTRTVGGDSTKPQGYIVGGKKAKKAKRNFVLYD